MKWTILSRSAARDAGRKGAPRNWDGWAKRLSAWVHRCCGMIFSQRWLQPPEATQFSARDPAQFGRIALTSPIDVFGDNQIQHEFGEPDSISNLLDRWSEPSVRPPLTMLFGHALLEREFARNAERGYPPILHVGDATNTSCRREFVRFRAAVIEAVDRWRSREREKPFSFVMMPGNHDGYFMGNFQSRLTSIFASQGRLAKIMRFLLNAQGVEWRCRCSDTFGDAGVETAILNKNDFILEYLQLLEATGQIAPNLPALKEFRERALVAKSEVLVKCRAGGFAQALFAFINPACPQRSFIVQLALMPAAQGSIAGQPYRTFLLVLDSANFRSRPRTAGMKGSITEAQVTAAQRLCLEMLGKGEGVCLLFALHHNLGALQSASRRRMARLFLAIRARLDGVVLPACLSAHRHRGGWYYEVTRSSVLFGDKVGWTDLNASSMVDWPLARRDLKIWAPPALSTDGGKTMRNFVLETRQDLLFGREQLNEFARHGLGKAIAENVLCERRSPLRGNPIVRICSLLINPLRDRYVAEYAILHEMARALDSIWQEAARLCPEGTPRNPCLGKRLQAALCLEPVKYETAFSPEEGSIADFVQLRKVVHDVHAAIDMARRKHACIAELISQALVIGALEDCYSQWRGWGFIPTPVGDRWYRAASNVNESFALVKPRSLWI